MPTDSLQYHKEKEALETLIHSEEFGYWCENGNLHHLQDNLQEYLDDLCLHNYVEEEQDWEDDPAYVFERCEQCGLERERTRTLNT